MDDDPRAGHPTSRCIACGSTDSTPAFSFTERERVQTVRACGSCGHHFLDGWDRTYDVALYDYYAPRLGRSKDELYDPLTTTRLREVLSGLRPGARGRLLDIGCGEGQLVDAALGLGFDARGIDVAEPAIAICRSFGLPCSGDDVFSAALDDERYDVVTLVETIEHVPDPRRMLQRARELLAPGGVVWATTPNVASLGRRVLGSAWPPFSTEHLSYFTPSSLRHLAHACGFASVHIGSRTLSAAAIRKLARRPSRASSATATGDAYPTGFEAEQRLRHRVAATRGLRLAKDAVNVTLSVTGLGETLVCELRAG